MSSAAKRHVAVVTDTTCDLPPEIVAQYGIHVVPQILIMGDKTWRDGIDINSAQFYELLRSPKAYPSTSQPSAATFYELFRSLAEQADGIVAVLISSRLSGTISSALTAAVDLPGIPLEIVDSRAVSMQLGYVVLAAARAAAAGGDVAAVAAAARAMMGHAGVYFVVDTLEYLHRNGRIGAAAKLFGSALNLKPLLSIQDGIVTPVAKIRSRRKALDHMVELVDRQVAAGARLHLAVVHVAVPDECARLKEELAARYQPVDVITAECGPVIGAHAGPGTLGAAFYVE